jgi:hypothetical protein
MNGFDGVERHHEITRVLDVDHQLRPPVRRHLPDGAEFLAAVRYKGLIPDFYALSHDAPPRQVELTVVVPPFLYGFFMKTRRSDYETLVP